MLIKKNRFIVTVPELLFIDEILVVEEVVCGIVVLFAWYLPVSIVEFQENLTM